MPSDFTNYNDLTFTLSYDYDTREVSSTFSVVSGATSQVELNVSLFDTLGNTTACSDKLVSSGGQLGCVVPINFGNGTIIAKMYKDDIQTGYAIINLKSKPSELYGQSLILVALFVFITLAGFSIGVDNPMSFGITLSLGSIIMVGLNIVYVKSWIGVGATLLWFILAIILVLIKGAGRQ